MKSNRITIYVCSVLAVLSGFGMYLIEKISPMDTDILQSICSGIFTGLIVSIVIAFIGYFHEREVLLNKADSNLGNLYINMQVLSQTMGNISAQIHTATEIDKLPFGMVSDLATYNIKTFEKMDLNLFEPFFPNSDLRRVYLRLDHLMDHAYNIKNIAQSLQKQMLEYTNSTLKAQRNTPNPNDFMTLDLQKNELNIRAAKFHEYVTSKTLELEQNLGAFYKCRHREKEWDNLKPRLDAQAEAVMRM